MQDVFTIFLNKISVHKHGVFLKQVKEGWRLIPGLGVEISFISQPLEPPVSWPEGNLGKKEEEKEEEM